MWFQNCLDREDILVIQNPHNFELTQSPQREHLVLESFFNFFDGNEVVLTLLIAILCSDNYTVGARTHWVDNLIASRQLETRSKDLPSSVVTSCIFFLHRLIF